MANGRLGRPEEAIDVALGCLLLRKTSSTPAVVPGAAPALAKAGVSGWTPIKSHGCGLGMPVGCECLANGTLAMDLALG